MADDSTTIELSRSEATQVKHILGSAAHAARALELSAGDDPTVGADYIAQSRILAHPVVDVLRRYPVAPRGWAGRRTDPSVGRVGPVIPDLARTAVATPIFAAFQATTSLLLLAAAGSSFQAGPGPLRALPRRRLASGQVVGVLAGWLG